MDNNQIGLNPSAKEDEGIDLLAVLKTIIRNKFLIIAITGLTTGFGLVTAITSKHIWKGGFEIVVDQKGDGGGNPFTQTLQSNPMISAISGLQDGPQYLRTEVKILKSPLVLRPVYEKVKAQRKNNGYDVSDWIYNEWSSKVGAGVQKGTNILLVSYESTNKDIILPILNEISDSYQLYSNRDRNNGIKNAIVYLNNQVAVLSKESKDAYIKAQSFAIANGLAYEDGLPMSSGTDSGGIALSLANLGVGGGGRDQMMSQLGAISVDSTNQTTRTQASRFKILYAKLQDLEGRLITKSSLLKPNATSIKSLKNQIAALKEALTRPGEAIIKHRALEREAMRKENLLQRLEDELEKMKIDKARKMEPWEVISKPTLEELPVGPFKKRMVIIGFLSGLISSSLLAMIKEKLNGKIFDKNTLTDLIPYTRLCHLNSKPDKSWDSAIELIANGSIQASRSNSIALIPIGDLLANELKEFENRFKKGLGKKDIVTSKDFLKTKDCSAQFLITSTGAVSKRQLEDAIQSVKLQGGSIQGWILLDRWLA